MRSNRSIPSVSIIPVLYYPQLREAVAWLRDVMGFTERLRIADHRVQLTFGDGAVVAAEGDRGPGERWTGHSIMVRVDDLDERFARARDAGARILHRPEDFAYGERQCTFVDPGGHAWTLTQSIADVDPASWGGELLQSADA